MNCWIYYVDKCPSKYDHTIIQLYIQTCNPRVDNPSKLFQAYNDVYFISLISIWIYNINWFVRPSSVVRTWLNECEVARTDKSYSELYCVHIWLRARQIGLSTWVEPYKSDSWQFCLLYNHIKYELKHFFQLFFDHNYLYLYV